MKKKDTRQELADYATEYSIGIYKIAWRGKDWAILDHMFCYNKKTKKWEYERQPSSRTPRFYKECRFGLLEAKQIVEELCIKDQNEGVEYESTAAPLLPNKESES